MKSILLFFLVPLAFCSPISPLPLVIWHGLGDTFANPAFEDIAVLANETWPGTHVQVLRLSDSRTSDRRATFFGNVTEQIDSICRSISDDPILSVAPALNALGFSQGGQFLRAYVERCNSPPIHTLITFGAQHLGIADFQACTAGDFWCHATQNFLRGNVWSDWTQGHVVPAQYFRDPEAGGLDEYLDKSNFLADINNERDAKNETYKDNIKKLKKFVMVVFKNDTTVIPKESGWFGQRSTSADGFTKLQDLPIYVDDYIGLRYLDEKNRLVFDEVEGVHMQVTDEDLKYYFHEYFGPPQDLDLDAEFTVQEEL